MTNPTTAAAPLTRREAREIERATGVRPVAAIAPTAVEGALTRRALREQRRAAEATELRDRLLRPAFDHRHDTGEIERNDVAALVSVLPAELVEHLSAGADEARPLAPVIPLRPDGAPRGASLRAPV
ncbi:MAG: hypothetical protein GXX90_03680, partial [Microbacteriaceae bacterium]|nr:hypothetical protein [Microbacteriaceae bacterium]